MIAKTLDAILAGLLVIVGGIAVLAASVVVLAAVGAVIGIPVATAVWIVRQAF